MLTNPYTINVEPKRPDQNCLGMSRIDHVLLNDYLYYELRTVMVSIHLGMSIMGTYIEKKHGLIQLNYGNKL